MTLATIVNTCSFFFFLIDYFSYFSSVLKFWYILKNNFIYLFLAVMGLCCCLGFYLVAASRGHCPAVTRGASHCRGFSCCRARVLVCRGFRSCGIELRSLGSWSLEHKFNRCGAQA